MTVRRVNFWRVPGHEAVSVIGPFGGPPQVSAHDGEVMAFPRLVVIFWGQAPEIEALGSTFLDTMLPSAYFEMLSEYNVNLATVQQIMNVDYAGPPEVLTEDQIHAQLKTWMEDGSIIAPPGSDETNLLFVLFAPPAVTLSLDGSVGGFLGYHGSTKYNKDFGKDNMFYAVVAGGLSLGLTTLSLSHELVEAFTNRSGDGWFSDDFVAWPFADTGRELGDICSCGVCPSLTLDGITLASYWRQSQNRCMQQDDLTPPPPPPPLGNLAVLVTPKPIASKAQDYVFAVSNRATGNSQDATITVTTGGPSSAVKPEQTVKGQATFKRLVLEDVVKTNGKTHQTSVVPPSFTVNAGSRFNPLSVSFW